MSEFMGLISGTYDAKAEGFSPGGGSLHSTMTPHGPDAQTFKKGSKAELVPVYQDTGIAFMFETSLMMKVSKWALEVPSIQSGYINVWSDLVSNFRG